MIVQQTREQAIGMMMEYIAHSMGRPHSNFRSEALFYCEDNGYDYRKAKEAYDADRAFEEQQLGRR